MNALTDQERNEGYRLLFDGVSLDGWAATRQPEGWAVQDGNIVCKGETNGYLHTVAQFDHFILHVEYRTAPKVNSGIFFRWSDLADPVNTGLEMQIWDTYDQEQMVKNSSGALYDLVAPSLNAVRPAGEWNQIRITCDRNQIQLVLNGTTVVEADIDQWSVAGKNPDGTDNKFKYAWRDQPRAGHIGLQDHGGYVEFRNIKILEL
ncbi:MAG: Oxidoreductase family, NAD-binding Rossmann fold [Paenibacillus sp.]|nr:Oxidoreductase family, NAD-binding Rossmann fold [Paenibacillus sp.]